MRFIVQILIVLLLAPTLARADERAAAEYNARLGGVSLLVLRDGKTVFEDYPNGGGPDKAWELASGTKSFWGVAAAVAVKDGLLTLDEKASDTLVEWRADKAKSAITIRQILNLTSGLKPAPIGRPPAYLAAVAAPTVAPAGAQFAYGPLNFQIFGEILRRKLERFEGGRFKTPLDYLSARILDPLGVKPAAWRKGADGYPHLPSGAALTARDWAKFGEFVRLGARHDGALLVDAKAFAENFEGSATNAAYGLTWWLNKAPSAEAYEASRTMQIASDLYSHPRRDDLPSDLFMAAGAGNQRLYIIPSKGLVVVRQYPKMFEFGRRGRIRDYSDVDFLLALLAP
jgi:CubicO group peptidase (beta-lactamase class C family)